jgi:tetratricopeptide (TPR) repeat protein
MATEESAPDGATEPGQDAPAGDTSASEDVPGRETPASEEAAAHQAAAEENARGSQTPADGESTGESQAAADGETAAGSQAPPDGETARELAEAGAEALTEAAFRTGDFARARELLEKARDTAAASGDQETNAFATERLGTLAHYENITKLIAGGEVPAPDAEAEERLFRQSLAISQELGDQAGTARSVFGVGLVFQVLRRDWPTAMPYYWQALGLSGALDESGDLYTRSEIHRHVGFYYHYEDTSPGEAVRHLQLSLDLREEIADPRLLPSALVALGEAELAAGNKERAVDLLTRAVTEARAARLRQHWVENAERALRQAQVAASGTADGTATDSSAGSDADADQSDGEA